MGSSIIKSKIKRLQNGESPRFLDLFAGCGGLSLGFTTAKYTNVGSIEIDNHAAQSHGLNFFNGSKEHSQARSVNDSPLEHLSQLCKISPNEKIDNQIDILIGGPPCQAFARVGRAKLRSEARKLFDPNAERAHLDDERVSLYQRYLTYVNVLKPVGLIMENVPDILNHGGENVAEIVAAHLEELNYHVEYRLLNASNYGVPQIRERMILQAVHKSAKYNIHWPKPTHYCELPTGYIGTRRTALKNINNPFQTSLFGQKHHYAFIEELDDLDSNKQNYLKTTTTKDALHDLPVIKTMDNEGNPTTVRGRRDLTIAVRLKKCNSQYADLMRNWPGFKSNDLTNAHVIRHLPRDFKFFKNIQHGWEYPQIHAWVEAKREAIIAERYKNGDSTRANNPEMKRIHKEWTIPYDPTKFPNKWWKLIPNKPSRTLLAHLGKDSYSHIHYDCKQARTISVREAARLQSFPDGFHFAGSMNAAFKQIGNAVPPLFAYSLAMALRETLHLAPIQDLRTRFLNIPKSSLGTLQKDKAAACISS